MRGYIRLALFFYYKKIEFNYKEPLLSSHPTIFLGNHQSGLIDPLYCHKKRTVFLFLNAGQCFSETLGEPLFEKFIDVTRVPRQRWLGEFIK